MGNCYVIIYNMEIMQGLVIPESIIMLIAGLVVLLFGYRIKKIAFFVIWFLLGFTGMNYLMPTITAHVPEIAATELYQFLIPIGGGLLLALLGFTIEKLCVGGISFALVMLIAIQYFGTDIQTLAISAVVGVIVAALAVNLMKPATIVATAIAGAYALTLAIFMIFAELDQATLYWPILIGLAVLGTGFQFTTTKRVR